MLMSNIDFKIFTRRGRPGNSTLCLDELQILTLKQNVFGSSGYIRATGTPFAWNYGKRGRSEVNMQIRDDLTRCSQTIVTFPLRLNSSVKINRDLCLQAPGVPFTYLFAEVDGVFRGRGLAPRPRAARLPEAQLSCGVLLSPSDEEPNALWFDITNAM